MEKKNGRKQKKPLVYKPYLKGSWSWKTILLRALRLLGYYGMFVVAFLLMGFALQLETPVLRWGVNLFVTAVCVLVVYASGASDGVREVMQGEIAWGQKEKGKPVAADDLRKCYNPVKGYLVFACAAAVLLALAIPHALTAQKQVYTLQTLPEWVEGYRGHEEITAPLSYYQREYTITAGAVVQIIVRMAIYPFVSAAALESKDAMLLVDRLSPLLILLPALGYPVGYLTGPRKRAAVHGDISANNRRRIRRERKAREARKEKRNELI
ncbi:MAG: hypothetical protein K5919_04190 [Clostridiales bacterium]|nr:hypothetical protein [Clostridiales bacterium]